MSSEDFYIPPSGITFQLVGYLTQDVLFSRAEDDSEGEVGQYHYDEGKGNEVFELLAGSDEHSGLYAIKNRTSKLFLYSRQVDTSVGHSDEKSIDNNK